MSNQSVRSLRGRLLDELSEKGARPNGYPTWWWAHSSRRGESTVAEARKELKKLEAEGLVIRVISSRNQIQWKRVEAE